MKYKIVFISKLTNLNNNFDLLKRKNIKFVQK